MKKALLGILICILASSALLAGCGDGADTSKHVAVIFGGASGYDRATGSFVQQTADGGFIICGWTADRGQKPDVYLIKTDRNGAKQWHQTFGGAGWDAGHCVRQTADGGFIICAETDQLAAVGSETLPGPQVYLIKTDQNGTEQWHRTFEGAGMVWGNCVQQTTDEGFIICGETGPLVAADSETWPGLDVYLIKTDQNGTEQWHRIFGGPDGGDYGHSVQQTADGGFIICGTSAGALYLVKTDQNGTEQWHRTSSGPTEGYGTSIQQTTDGGFIICGGILSPSVSGCGDDMYLLKMDQNGIEQWHRIFGGPDEGDYGHSVQQTADGGFIICGETASFGAGSMDVYLVKTDQNGTEQWHRTFGGPYVDHGASVQQTADGGFVMCGDQEGVAVYLIITDAEGNID